MKGKFIYALAALMGFALVAAPLALAQAAAVDTHVTFPWGQYVAAALTTIGGAATWFVGIAMGALPGPVQFGAKVLQLDQVIGRSIEAAAHDLAADVASKGFTVDVRNAMLAATIKNVQANAVDLATKYAPTLETKVKARITAYINDLAKKATK